MLKASTKLQQNYPCFPSPISETDVRMTLSSHHGEENNEKGGTGADYAGVGSQEDGHGLGRLLFVMLSIRSTLSRIGLCSVFVYCTQ